MVTAIQRALKNIAAHGDTDIFPFPFERYLIMEDRDACEGLLTAVHRDFEASLASHPPLTIEALSPVGYSGFRRATLIEPFWNAYYLALVISIAADIEKVRVPLAEESVFSYRFKWDDASGTLFSNSTWNDYRRKALDQSKSAEFVVLADIADFYPRVNHHRLENALGRLNLKSDIPSRILKLLTIFSETESYGLPVGGPASRTLAELALNDTDRHLQSRNVAFCRYADDYTLFCDSKSAAYKLLVLLSEKLANDGLSLQKHKSRILTAAEFAEINRFLDPKSIDDPVATEEQKLLNISIRFDPYSDTAVEDYEMLKEAVREIDIIGILSREIGKTIIDQVVVKQAINALKALAPVLQEQAIRILLDRENLLTLSPVFITVMRAVRGVYTDLTEMGKARVDDALVDLYQVNSHLLAVDLNLSYYVQALSLQDSEAKAKILIQIFENTSNHFLRRQIILVMGKWHRHYFLTDVKRHFKTYTEWERRAIIVASFRLGDEGRHWRRNMKSTWSPAEVVVQGWAEERARTNRLDNIG